MALCAVSCAAPPLDVSDTLPFTAPLTASPLALLARSPASAAASAARLAAHAGVQGTRRGASLFARLSSPSPASLFAGPAASRVMISAFTGVSKAHRLKAGRSVHYETGDTYVFIAPGEDEAFLSRSEVLQFLITELKTQQEGGRGLSDDLAVFETLEEAAEFLLASACELELGDGKGALQWFEVRLEPSSSE